MFSFVDIQECIPNINGIESFNKLLKKSHSALTESWSIAVHNVWVLPGHIIVSVDEGHKLLSFDLLPKPKPWPDLIDFLNTKHVSKKKGQKLAAFEVFSVGLAPLFLFIVMKNAEVYVWKFVRPSFEWNFICKINLSIGKNIQIMSSCFDVKSKTLFWCERRTTTQCCICKSVLNVNQKDIFGKTSVILHNCPPVQLYIVGFASVLLHPTANSPVGLTMFWSAASDRIQLHIWNSPSNGVLPVSPSSDFQSLVTDSISIWINNTVNDPAAVAYYSHEITQELFILESTLSLFSVKIDSEGQPIFKKVCCLDKSQLGELNQRKKYRILIFQKFIGLFLDDDEFFVFETYNGMLVWTYASLRNERPRIWVGQGLIPQVGVWSASAVRMLRSDSVVKQAMKMLKFNAKTDKPSKPRERRISKEYTLQLTLNIDKGIKQTRNQETYIVVEEEEDGDSNAKANKDKVFSDSVNYQESQANSDSLLLVSEYLRDWDSKNYSSEILHWLLTNQKLNINSKWLQISNDEELTRINSIFNNPCISLALFYENPKYKKFVDQIIKGYVVQHERENTDDIDPELFSLIKQYCSLVQQKEFILCNEDISTKRNTNGACQNWRTIFESLLQNETLSKQDFFEIMQWASETKKLEFIDEILNIFDIQHGGEGDANNAISSKNIVTHLSKAILRSDTGMFELVCNGLWETYPKLIPEFLKRVSDGATFQQTQGFLRSSSRSSLVSEGEIVDRAIRSLKTVVSDNKLSKEQVKILAELHLSADYILAASSLYLDNKMYSDAIDLLASYSDNSDIHYQLFYSIITSLIENQSIGQYSEKISMYIPSQFLFDEFFHVVKALEDHNQLSDVFISSDKQTSFGELEPLFRELLKKSPSQADS